MKSILLIAVFCNLTLLAIAQGKFDTQFMYGRNNLAIEGGKEGKLYAAIIKTNMSKKEIIEKTTSFLLKYRYVSAHDIHLDEISQETSEYSIPFCFTQTQFYSNMRVMYPVRLYGILRFEFHAGGLLLVAENMSSELLCVSHHGTPTERSDAYEAFFEETNALLITETLLGNVLIWANMTPEERVQFYKNVETYFDQQAEKISVYSKLTENGEAIWMNAQQLCLYLTQHSAPGSKYQVQWLENSVIPHKLLVEISDKRWENQVRGEHFDKLFILLAHYIGGYIEGIKEDDTQTWSLEENTLLPTNAKQRAFFKKKNKDFYLK